VAALVFVAGALAGCAAGPDYRAPTASAPAHYVTRSPEFVDGAARDDWWQALGDPALDGLVDAARRDNPGLAAATARVRASREQARLSRAALWPELDATGKVSRDRLSRNSENLANLPFPNPRLEFTDYRAGFDASWELDLAGHARRTVEGAVARAQSEGESRHDAELVLIAEVVDAYVDVRSGQARSALAERAIAAARETERLVALQHRAGLASDLDRDRSTTDRLAVEARRPPIESDLKTAEQRLAALTARDPAALAVSLAPGPLPASPGVVPVGLPADLLRRRPDVRRAERELAAASADVGVAVADLFPRLSLVGDVGVDAIHAGDLTNGASRYWNVGPQLRLPLFAAGRLRASVRARQALYDAALASYRSTVLQAFADTESALIRFATARRQLADLRELRDTARRDLDLARRRYAAGDTALTDVLDVERRAIDADDQAEVAASRVVSQYAALSKALGGGWADGGPPAGP
jgi:NodT family efflux transporter outer membrane factor (OMF) lipoprotein